MKHRIFTLILISMISFSIFAQVADFVTVKVRSSSKTENLKSNFKTEKWDKNTQLLTISFTNTGTKTEYIKDISIKLNKTPEFGEQSSFLYGGSCMGRTPVQQRNFNDSVTDSQTFLLAKVDNKKLFKVAILTWEIFQAKLSHSKSKGIVITADGENKPVKPGETINFEKIIIEQGINWQDMLFNYGKQIAKYHNIKPKEIIPFKGWSTWDYYGQRFTDKEIKMNMVELKAAGIEGNIIQVDGGWWNFRGDYLDSRTDIEGGMKGVSKYVAAAGYTPGIHIDGFRGEKGSEVYKAHPDYFLKDQNGETFYTESERTNRTEYTTCFDYSNPAAREYIKNVLKTMKNDWGVKYFKIDFMRYGLKEDIMRAHKKTGLKEIKAFDPTMTSMERTRAGLKAMREGLGDAFFLGCSSVFGPTLGIVDGLRTGGDIFPNYEAYTARCLQNGGNFYLNKTVVQNDADYLIVRNKDDEEPERAWKGKFGGTVTLNEAAMWADYIALFGGIQIVSDNLKTLRPERKDLVKKAFELTTCDRFIPLDMWDKANHKDDAFNIMLGENAEGVYLALFNWNDKELGIALKNLPTNDLQLISSLEKPYFIAKKNSFDIKLKGRTSVVFKLNKKANFDKVRKQISYNFHN